MNRQIFESVEVGGLRLKNRLVRGNHKEAPGLHVSAKLNSNDFTPGGLDESEALALCRLYADAGLNSIEASGNGTSVAGVRAGRGEAYFMPFAARLASEVDVPVMLVGGLRSREAMQHVLDATDIELLSLSRPLLFDPAFPNKLANGEVDESACISCNACYSTIQHRCRFRR